MEKSSRIYVAGSGGMVGSSIVRLLKKLEYTNVITRTSKELDLRDTSAVDKFFTSERPEYVFLAAAKVGGIHANNTHRGEFIRDNLMIQTNVIHACCVFDVKKMIFLGSSCIYPRDCPQPIREEYLLSGPLEDTNKPYAVAKIAGIEMCDAYKRDYGCDFVSVMPTNLAGPGDNYNLTGGHVFAALVRKFYEAKKLGLPNVVVWGTGSARRDFMHVDDLARGILMVMQSQEDLGVVNMGSGKDVSILEFAELIREVVGYEGGIVFDTSKPDGTPVKIMDCSKAHGLGWTPELSLRETVELVFEDFSDNYERYCKSHRIDT
ncbi:GDP-L-fucose synthase 2 [Acanthocystis turfacea Chlorella virus MO0605SPH]|nr:GDP-L-fucose synthase 2 [Acanthocystis turfacea Chlorella virus MO0605SPH]